MTRPNQPFNPDRYDPRIFDFSFYAAHLLKIKTHFSPGCTGERNTHHPSTEPIEKIVPFIFNPPQRRLHEIFEQQLKQRGYVRIDVLKARREGISTYVEGRGFHKCVTTPNTHGFIVAHDKDSLNTLFSMSKLFYDELPPYYRPMIRYSSKKELVFENPNPRDRFTNPGLRSKIEVFSAKKITSTRSGGYTWAHLSEVAFWPDPDNLCPSIMPTVPDLPGTFIIRESTANGRGNYWHNEWLADCEGETNFTPIFFSWLDFPEYARQWDYDGEEKELMATLDDEETYLLKHHNATPFQLHWRRHKIMDLQGDVELFHQEYPTTPEEAFISSGVCYFNRQKLRSLLSSTSPPIFVGDISPLGLVENSDGSLSIWRHPEKGAQYCIGIDVGGGQIEGDPSVIEVVKVPRGSPLIEQVAEWRGWVDPVETASKAISIALYYNNALVAPEINNHGLTCLNELKANYWNIYRWQYFDRFGKYYSQKLGWETNISTKPILCDYTSACLNAGILVIHSADLIQEMLSFIRKPTGGGEAEVGSYDDRVMAFMIAVFCTAHDFQSASVLNELGLSPNPILKEERVGRQKVEVPDFISSDPFLFSQPRFSGADAWLNY